MAHRHFFKRLATICKDYPLEIFLIVILLVFSSWLMNSTFSYKDGAFIIAAKAWSDFAAQIPLIRSFSFGDNFPPQYPLFPGLPIHYHFLFYLLVGVLEKIGFKIDLALNIPSIVGFFSLLMTLYFLGRKIFSSKMVGVLSVLFFLFNGSFSFLYFFQKNPLSPNTIQKIIANTNFASFGPYDNNLVSAFWNLNIYTNQRHLAASFAFSLIVLYIFLLPVLQKPLTHKNHAHFFSKKIKNVMEFFFDFSDIKQAITKSIVLGLLLGSFFFFHIAVFGMTTLSICLLSLFFKRLRLQGLLIIIVTCIIAYPQYKYLNSVDQAFGSKFYFGYLAANGLTFFSFIKYWTYNLGLHIVFIPLGFFYSSIRQKKILITFFVFFIIGNIVQISPDIATNHKFFNYFMLVGNMFTAYFLVMLWGKTKVLRPVIIVSFFFLVFSGIIDFFPIYNDTKGPLSDYPKNPDITWIMKNTPKNSIFLNTSFLYAPESMAGRKIFLGWPYFAWSAGYDTTGRHMEIKKILSSENKAEICTYLQKHNLSYISITHPSEDFPYSQEWFEKTFIPVYKNPSSGIVIYAERNNCKT